MHGGQREIDKQLVVALENNGKLRQCEVCQVRVPLNAVALQGQKKAWGGKQTPPCSRQDNAVKGAQTRLAEPAPELPPTGRETDRETTGGGGAFRLLP
jgi:hypothetical protein